MGIVALVALLNQFPHGVSWGAPFARRPPPICSRYVLDILPIYRYCNEIDQGKKEKWQETLISMDAGEATDEVAGTASSSREGSDAFTEGMFGTYFWLR